MRTFFSRLLSSVASVRSGETKPAMLMFAYSFLAMTSYNILKPITRSQFIASLGSENLPYVLFAAGISIGVIMHFYTNAVRRVPRQYVVPVTQGAIVVLLVVFWALLSTGAVWVTVAFYLFGLILGILLISQFWTLANDIFDARQAKRLFGFIGGGASLGGALGAGITAAIVEEVGSGQLLLVSAVALAACAGIVVLVLRNHRIDDAAFDAYERGIGGQETIRLVSESRTLRILALTVGCAAAGAAVVDQQLSMAAEALSADGGGDSIAAFLAEVTVYLSITGFVVQVALVSRIHRTVGIGVALLLLPLGFSASAAVILATGALAAVVGARVIGTTLRYTLDKTTREVLFLPLPAELRNRVKPFIDVTMDRFAKAVTALVLLVLIQPWGFGLDWRRLSYATLAITGLWVAVALRARQEYLRAFRASIDTQALAPDAVMTPAGEAATVETLVEELSNPDATSVLYAIDMLEAMDKPHLITPLLLRHESGAIRVRALRALASGRSRVAERWKGAVERMTRDDDVDVRAAALMTLAALDQRDVAAVMPDHLDGPEPRVAVAAAAALARSGEEAGVQRAESTFQRLINDTRDTAVEGRKEAARALSRIDDPRFRLLLVPLLYDYHVDVALEAVRSARSLGASDGLFLPALFSRLGHRVLRHAARETLVACGEEIVPALRYALENPHEHHWVRRNIPAILSLVPSQAAADALVGSLETDDGFLRYKIIAALERLRRDHAELVVPQPAVEALFMRESRVYCDVLTLRHNLLTHAPAPHDSVLERALGERLDRILDRIYRLLGVLHEVDDLTAARHAIERGSGKRRARAIEYLDNLLRGNVRKQFLPFIDESSSEAKVDHANRVLGTRPRDLEDTLAQLIHDDNPVVAATAIHFVARRDPLLARLIDDVEWVSTHRAATHPRVSAAADWVLSARDPRRAAAGSARDGLPVVELADRLSRIPIFEFVSVDDLFRVIESGQEVRYAAGQAVGVEGATEAVELLIDGSVRRVVTPDEYRDVPAPGVIGLEEVLQGSPTLHPTLAKEPCVCFRIRAADFMAMVTDDVRLAQGLFRLLLGAAAGRRNGGPAHLPAVTLPSATLQPFDKAMLVRQHPLLARAAVGDLLALVGAARELSLWEGETLFRDDDAASFYLVLDGIVQLESDGVEPLAVGPGGMLLVSETLAGALAGCRGTVVRACRVLRAERDEVFMVLSERTTLLQDLFSGIFAVEGPASVKIGGVQGDAADVTRP